MVTSAECMRDEAPFPREVGRVRRRRQHLYSVQWCVCVRCCGVGLLFWLFKYKHSLAAYLVPTYLFNKTNAKFFLSIAFHNLWMILLLNTEGSWCSHRSCWESKLEEWLPGSADISRVVMRHQLLVKAASLWQRPTIESSSSLAPCSLWCDAPSCHIYRDLPWGENGEGW